MLNNSYYSVDQDFNLNIIILLLVTVLKLTLFAIAQTSYPVFYIRTADSNSSPLAKYIKFEFGCRGIWRIVYMFICLYYLILRIRVGIYY
jgi:hypothetical protein